MTFVLTYRIRIILSLLFLCLYTTTQAHEVITSLSEMSKEEAVIAYVALGFQHIIPKGLDHILFVVSLFLVSPQLKTLLWQVSTFTIAHSITLGLAMYGVLAPPAAVVEPLVALTIVYVALENIRGRKATTSRLIVVFIFGLIHGLGFASALGGLGLPKDAYLLCLIMFNIGVELGQLTLLIGLYFLIGKFFSQKPYYHKWIVTPVSVVIFCTALYWTVERLFF